MQISDRNLERLIEKSQLVSPEQLGEARLEIRRHPQNPPSLQAALLNLGFLTEDALLRQLAADSQIRYIDVDALSPDPALVTLLPEELALEKGCLVIERQDQRLVVAMQDPNDLGLIEQIERLCKMPARSWPSTTTITRFTWSRTC
jgi:hypothetical protein